MGYVATIKLTRARAPKKQYFYCIYFEEIAERILKNVPEQNKKYVQKQLEQLEKNFMDYLYYWNEKYYRNGFVDVIELLEI